MMSKLGKAILIVTALAPVAYVNAANADTVSTIGSLPTLIDTANGTPPSSITFLATTQNVSAGGQYAQQFTFVSGYDGAAGPVSFSADEVFSNGSSTSPFSVTGVENVSPTADPDQITINGGQSFTLGGLMFTTVAQTFSDAPPFPGGSVNGTLDFNVTSLAAAAPEPSTWAMMILGFCGLGFMAYRRKGAALSAA